MSLSRYDVRNSRQLGAPSADGLITRPKQRPGIAAFSVANEMVLLSPQGDVAHALNESAASVWNLCDGQHTPLDMLDSLRERYDGRNVSILSDVTSALFRFHHLGLVDLEESSLAQGTLPPSLAVLPGSRPRVRFVFGIEDRSYFHWQLAILFESLVGQLQVGWDITVVVCNDHQPLSPELTRLLEIYSVRAVTGQNHAHSHKIDFSAHDGGYVALNRVEALKVIAGHVDPEDVVCLMDTDLFLYGDLKADLFPSGNAMAANDIMNDPLFLGRGSDEIGIDLQMVLGALGCSAELKRGGVTVFMTGATLANPKVLQDCFRFAQIIYLLGKAAGLGEHNVWMSEMACFAMALTANGVEYELLDVPQFGVPQPDQATAASGSFFHYYADINDGNGAPFAGSEWHKQLFGTRDFLAENLESFRKAAHTEVERRFFDLAIAARKRIFETRAS